MKKTRFILTMAFIIVGVSTGAGILGLPLELGQSGLLPALTGLFLVWLLMFAVGWVFIYKLVNSTDEINDYATLYQKELGIWAKTINSVAYLFTFYCLLIAFICGASSIIVEIIPALRDIPFALKYVEIIFFILSTSVVIYGVEFIRKFNALLVFLLLAFFFILLILIVPYFNISYLTYQNWSHIPFEMPILAAAFGYQIVLPVICKHTKARNMPKNENYGILFLGTFIILIINILWIVIVLGVLPRTSPNHVSILHAYKLGAPITVCLVKLTNSNWIIFTTLMFSFLAIATSYIGVGAGLMNYIKDITKHYIKRRNKTTNIILTFAFPLVIALIYPNIFIKMLNIVGGIGVITCFGILPGIMALKRNNAMYIRILGVFIFTFSIFIFIVECSTLI